MSGTINVDELKRELQKLHKGEFRLGYVYADDIVHLVDVFKAIDRLSDKKDCNTCRFYKDKGSELAVCETCSRNYSDYYAEIEKQPTVTNCYGCMGATFNDCEICDERGEDK